MGKCILRNQIQMGKIASKRQPLFASMKDIFTESVLHKDVSLPEFQKGVKQKTQTDK
jgi:hypothetical protein